MANPLATLLLFSFAMITLPVGGFFVSKSFVYEGKKGLININYPICALKSENLNRYLSMFEPYYSIVIYIEGSPI